MWVIQLLKEPYPLNSIRKMIWFGAFVAVFVFLFLSFFQPFGLGAETLDGLLKVTSAYGLITFATIALGTVALRSTFPGYFQENQWVFGRELLITLFNFFLIGVFNTLYSDYMFSIGLTLRGFLFFQLYTMGVGFFPIIFFMMLKYTHLLRTNTQSANDLSGSIPKVQYASNSGLSAKIRIHSELKKDDLEIYGEHLVYAETADNYVAVYHLLDDKLQKSLVRSTMGRLENDVEGYPRLIRCHRAFLVNLDYLESFRGNAQGLQLRLKHSQNEIPVSRNMVAKIKKLLE
jgi:hypothetical protein